MQIIDIAEVNRLNSTGIRSLN